MAGENTKTCTVGDVAAPVRNALVGGPFGSDLVSADYVPCGVPVIRGQNLSAGKFVGGEFAFVTDDKADKLHANLARPGDLVFTQRGNAVLHGGQVAMVPDHPFQRYVVSQSQMKLTPDQTKVDSRFLYFVFSSSTYGDYLRSTAIVTGVPHTNLGLLRDFVLSLPPLPEQKRIAHILGTLDDKIELNRGMNATLEAMSRALFKSWFVDFDPVRQKAAGRQPVGMDAKTAALFPDSFEESEIGKVPKGWGIAEVRDLLSLSREAVDPSEHPIETFDHYSIPAFDSGCWPSPDRGADIKSQKLLVAPGSVLISKLNPRTPRVWIPYEPRQPRPIASTEFLVAVPNETIGVGVPFIFCFASSESVIEYLASHASGTSNSHQRVRPDDFLSLRTALAPNNVLQAFGEVVGPHLQRSNHARSESRTLAALRDTLLPKLLAGELRVSKAEQAIREANA
jgi:type I restriction enzyme, S subunit